MISGAGFFFARMDDGELGRWILLVSNFVLALVLMIIAAKSDEKERKVWQGRSTRTLVGIALSLVALALALKDLFPHALVD